MTSPVQVIDSTDSTPPEPISASAYVIDTRLIVISVIDIRFLVHPSTQGVYLVAIRRIFYHRHDSYPKEKGGHVV